MKTSLISSLALAVLACVSSAQTFTIFVENSELLDAEGAPITFAENKGFKVWAAPYAPSLADTSSFFESLTPNLLSGSVEAISEFKGFLGGLTWTQLGDGLTAPQIDFEVKDVPTVEGSRPLLLMANADDFESIDVGTQLGLIGATSPAAQFSGTTYAFNAGPNSLTEVYIGTSGSLQAAQIVPEPSSFAALAGVMTLGLVMMRRRRA